MQKFSCLESMYGSILLKMLLVHTVQLKGGCLPTFLSRDRLKNLLFVPVIPTVEKAFPENVSTSSLLC